MCNVTVHGLRASVKYSIFIYFDVGRRTVRFTQVRFILVRSVYVGLMRIIEVCDHFIGLRLRNVSVVLNIGSRHSIVRDGWCIDLRSEGGVDKECFSISVPVCLYDLDLMFEVFDPVMFWSGLLRGTAGIFVHG